MKIQEAVRILRRPGMADMVVGASDGEERRVHERRCEDSVKDVRPDLDARSVHLQSEEMPLIRAAFRQYYGDGTAGPPRCAALGIQQLHGAA